jgi:putative endonuclease
MYFVYIIKLENGDFYTGSTSNVDKRIEYHNQGKVPSTSPFLPVKLRWFSGFSTKRVALEFEKYLKSSSDFAFRNKRLV